MNTAQNLFIRSLSVDWSEVEEGSYLRSIPALKDLDILRFRKNITFFVGENGSGRNTTTTGRCRITTRFPTGKASWTL